MRADERDNAYLWDMRSSIRRGLAHRYGDINLHELWQTIKRDLPELISKLDALIPPIRQDQE